MSDIAVGTVPYDDPRRVEQRARIEQLEAESLHGPLEPIEIVVTRVCAFKRKPCGLCGKPKTNAVHKKSGGSCKFKRQLGCEHCGKPMNDPDHLGAPESFNVFASGGGWEVYQGAIKRWKVVLGPLLKATDLPSGLGHVLVEAECSFGDQRARDQDNHRVIVSKALGDTLVEGGWLVADTWERYEVGGFRRRELAGVNRIRLMLFPSWDAMSLDAPDGAAAPLFS